MDDVPFNPLLADARVVPAHAVLGQAPTFGAGHLFAQSLQGLDVNPYGGPGTDQNAAGTAENVALHVAVIVALSLLGVYVLRGSGFRFVIAAGIGGTS